MTAFTHMQMTMQEEDNLPNLAVQAFRDAFKQVNLLLLYLRKIIN